MVPEAVVAVVWLAVALEIALEIDDATDEAAEDKDEAAEESVSVAEAVSVLALPDAETAAHSVCWSCNAVSRSSAVQVDWRH